MPNPALIPHVTHTLRYTSAAGHAGCGRACDLDPDVDLLWVLSGWLLLGHVAPVVGIHEGFTLVTGLGLTVLVVVEVAQPRGVTVILLGALLLGV